MANLPESNTYEPGIYQIETTDFANGGVSGTSNIQAKQLANRTTYLKDQVGLALRYGGVTVVTASAAITASANNILADGSASIVTISLPSANTVPAGFIANITAINNTGPQVRVAPALGGDDLYMGGSRSVMYLGVGDNVQLVSDNVSRWYVVASKGNFDLTGEVSYGYSVLPNTVEANGQLLLRSYFPRLWAYVNALGTAVTDASWVSGDVLLGGVNAYKGRFSLGNGFTTFRVPDLRSMFLRGIDDGRGLDVDRLSYDIGSYEADDYRYHTHGVNDPGHRHAITPGGAYGPAGGGGTNVAQATGGGNTGYALTGISIASNGGTETRPVNVGLYPLIKV